MPYQSDTNSSGLLQIEFPSVTQEALGNVMTGPFRFFDFDAKTGTISFFEVKLLHQCLPSCSPEACSMDT